MAKSVPYTQNVIVDENGRRISVEIADEVLSVFDSNTTGAVLLLAQKMHPDLTFHVISLNDYLAGHFA